MNNVAKKKTYQALDAWRGIACLMVVLCHTYGALETKIAISRWDILYPLAKWGGLGVQIFFVISGYCIISAAMSLIKNERSVFHFVAARCRRILPPYWLAIPFYLAHQGLGYFLVAHHYVHAGKTAYLNPFNQSLLFYAANLSLIQTPLHQRFLNEIAWTLNYELAFYAVCALILLMANYRSKAREQFTITTAHLLTLAVLIATTFRWPVLPFPLDLWPQFGLGIVVYDLLQRNPKGFPSALCYAILLLAATAGIGALCAGNRTGLHGSALSWCVCLGFALLLIAGYRFDAVLQRNRIWKWLGNVGTASYTIYLLHTVVIVFAAQAVAMAHLPGTLSLAISLIITTFAAAISYFCFPFIEKPFLGTARPLRRDPVSKEQIPATGGADLASI